MKLHPNDDKNWSKWSWDILGRGGQNTAETVIGIWFIKIEILVAWALGIWKPGSGWCWIMEETGIVDPACNVPSMVGFVNIKARKKMSGIGSIVGFSN